MTLVYVVMVVSVIVVTVSLLVNISLSISVSTSVCTSVCMSVCFQLVVGSEDYDIRVFREDEIIAEMTETEVLFHVVTHRQQ